MGTEVSPMPPGSDPHYFSTCFSVFMLLIWCKLERVGIDPICIFSLSSRVGVTDDPNVCLVVWSLPVDRALLSDTAPVGPAQLGPRQGGVGSPGPSRTYSPFCCLFETNTEY